MNEKYINKYLIKPADDGSRLDTKLAVEFSDKQIEEFKLQGYLVVEDEDFQKLIGNDEGKEYLINKDGTLSEKPPYEPTPEEIIAQTKQYLTNVVQNYLDTTVQARGYDGILSVCSYIDTGNEQFDAEGIACRKWRSAVWAKCYELEALVLAGEMEVPSEEELITLLPVLEW